MENIIGCSMVDIRGVQTLEKLGGKEIWQQINNLQRIIVCAITAC